MPMASTSPQSEMLLRLKPRQAITAKVPTSETGTAIRGISVARQFCRNSSTTMATRTMASNRALNTSWIDSRDEGRRVVDDGVVQPLRETAAS